MDFVEATYLVLRLLKASVLVEQHGSEAAVDERADLEAPPVGTVLPLPLARVAPRGVRRRELALVVIHAALDTRIKLHTLR
jgi:hypothetical protein